MTTRGRARWLGLAVLAVAGGEPLAAATAPSAVTDLRPMVIVECEAQARLVQQATLFLSAVGAPASATQVTALAGSLFLSPGLDGLDASRSLQLFLLTRDPPDGLPSPAALLPVVGDGRAYLDALHARYERDEATGGVRAFSGPHHDADPELLYVAVAERHALVATDVPGLRWLAVQRRDRTTPRAADLGTLLRLSIDGASFGLLLELMGRLEEQSGPQANPALARNLQELGVLCGELERLDVGLSGDARRLTLLVRATAPSNSVLAQAFSALAPVTQAADRLPPPAALAATAGGTLAAIAALPPRSRDWLEDVAGNTRLLGLHVRPGAGGWLSALVGTFAADHVAWLQPAPDANVRLVRQFALRDAPAAARTVARLAARDTNSVARLRGGTTIHAFSLLADGAARADAGVGDGLLRLLQMACVEVAVVGDRLLVVQGAPGALDDVLDAGPGAADVSCVSEAQRFFLGEELGGTLVGGTHLAPVEAVRTAVARLPGVTERQLETLPRPGAGLGVLLTREGRGITWRVRFSTSELFALRSLRQLDESLLQEITTQFALQQIHDATSEGLRQGERLLRQPLAPPPPAP